MIDSNYDESRRPGAHTAILLDSFLQIAMHSWLAILAGMSYCHGMLRIYCDFLFVFGAFLRLKPHFLWACKA